MIPHPMAILVVSRAITAVIAVDERASIECLRHHGYASASQKESQPAASHARAMVTVSSIGSMLSCKTPIRKGTVIGYFISKIFIGYGSIEECTRPLIKANIPFTRGM